MDWKREAENELKLYYTRCTALDNLKLRIFALREDMQSTKSFTHQTVPVRGGGSRMEDALVNKLVECQRLELNYKLIYHLVELARKSLEHLNEQDRLVLERFYMERFPNFLPRLCEELHMERAQIYRIKDKALYKFTCCMYGMCES